MSSAVPPWMAADSCGLRTLALTVAGAGQAIEGVARRIEGVFADTAARLGWWGPAARAASTLGQERATQLHGAVTAAHELVDALTLLADGLDQHTTALHEALQQAQALDADSGAAPPDPHELDAVLKRRAALDTEIQAHVDALAALDRQAALGADDAFRRLSAVLGEVGQVHWLGGVTRVVVRFAARETGALPPAAAADPTAAADGGVSWPFQHLGDSPSCGDNATAAEKACSGLNGLATGVGTVTGGIDALTQRVEAAREVLRTGAASAPERAWASRVLAEVGEYQGAARIVELGTDARYAALAGKTGPVVGGLLAGWAGYQGEVDKGHSTGVALGVGATEAVADTGIGWAAVTGGAEAGALIGSAVPGAGTALGAVVGAGTGALVAVFASNQVNGWISDAWESAAGEQPDGGG